MSIMEDMLVVRNMEPKDVICTMIDILLAGIDTVSDDCINLNISELKRR